MFKKTFYKSVRFKADSPIYLYYYILEDDFEYEGFSIKSYGVEVVKLNLSENDEIERKSIPNVYNSYKQIKDLLDLLSRNCVTPISILDVVEDILAQDQIPIIENPLSIGA